MSRQTHTAVACLLIALTLFTGCHPTQPFFFHEDGDLSHYLDVATRIEHPDVRNGDAAGRRADQGPVDDLES